MQVDKAVSHQFSLCLPCNLHEPLSTCGMLSQHLDGAWLGFKFCWSQYIPSEMSQTQLLWTCSVSHAGNTVGASSWFLSCPAGVCEAHTTNQHGPLPWICENMVQCWLYWLLALHTPWPTPQHNLEGCQQQLHISCILYTPTCWPLNARLLGTSWDLLGLVGTSWEWGSPRIV